MCSVALSGLSFVNALVPGVKTPVCGLSRLRRFSPDSNRIFVSSVQRRSSSCLRVFVFDCPLVFHRIHVELGTGTSANKYVYFRE